VDWTDWATEAGGDIADNGRACREWLAEAAHRAPGNGPSQRHPCGTPLPSPVPIDRVTSAEDLIRCEPLHCVLTAGACVARQRRHGAKGRAWYSGPKPKADMGRCRDCELGRRVVEVVG